METRSASVVDVQRYLIKDERVVWSAQPVRKFFLKYQFSQDPSRFLGYYFIVLGLVFVVGRCRWPLKINLNNPILTIFTPIWHGGGGSHWQPTPVFLHLQHSITQNRLFHIDANIQL